MREVRIEKVTLNIGTGGAGESLEKGTKLLETITKRKPIQTKSNKRIPTWGVRPGLAVGTKVTLRAKPAEDLLKRFFSAVDNKISPNCFDNRGNFSFGIPEYIDIPGLEYMVEVGIIGLQISVTLERRGFRIKKRSHQRRKIKSRHNISKSEAIDFVKSKFNINILKEEE